MNFHRATFVEINLDAFRHNLRTIKMIVGSDSAIMAIIKADAYGHGAVQCARAALKEGINHFGVGIIQEGIELRENGISSPILILGGVSPDEVEHLIKYNLSTSLSNPTILNYISKQAKPKGKKIGVHIKVDTGMSRLGVKPEKFLHLFENVVNDNNLTLEGIFTHLARADEENVHPTDSQISTFLKVLKTSFNDDFTELIRINSPLLVHSANTAGLLRFPKSRFNMVRPGISLYGSLPSSVLNETLNKLLLRKGLTGFQPVMHWKTKIIQIQTIKKGTPVSYGARYIAPRDSLIATLPVGYADGLNRCLSNKIDFLINGERVKQVGTICMDMCLVDVTDIPEIALEEEVVIFGMQGNNQILVEELATKAETISYEILCGVGKRVPRVYI